MFNIDSKKENLQTTSGMVHLKQGQNKGRLPDQRKTLQVLQQTPDNRLTRTPVQLLQSGKGSSQSLKKKVFPIFKDPSHTSSPKTQPSKVCVHVASQTEGENCHCTCHEDEAFKLMGQEEVPEEYWKDLAETRRQALEDSLHENELLHESVGELRRENKRLSELAEHAEYFANLLKEIASKEEEDEEETEAESEPGVKDTSCEGDNKLVGQTEICESGKTCDDSSVSEEENSTESDCDKEKVQSGTDGTDSEQEEKPSTQE